MVRKLNPSTVPTAENAQQDPQFPWSLIFVTAPKETQSFESLIGSIESSGRVFGVGGWDRVLGGDVARREENSEGWVEANLFRPRVYVNSGEELWAWIWR